MRYVVVGLHAAGRSACSWLRKLDPAAEIIGLDPNPAPPYSRPLISYALAQEIDSGLLYLKESDLFAKLGVNLVLERAASLDPERKVVVTQSGREISYDKLLVATGASPRKVDLSGDRASEVLYFRSRRDLAAIEEKLVPGGVAAVLGGGLVGYKLTHGLLARGLKVKLIVASPRPLSLNVDAHVGGIVGKMLADTPGVELLVNSSLTGLSAGRERRYLAQMADGTSFECDLVAAGKGVVPETSWLASSGLASEQGIMLDAKLMSEVPDVYAAGDLARVYDLALGSHQVNAIWPLAVEQGRYAAWNMAGNGAAYPGGLAMNSIPLPCGFMISVGAVNPRYTQGCEIEALEISRDSYLALVFKDKRLIGAVGLNAPPRLGELGFAVRQGLSRSKIPASWFNNPKNAAPLAAATGYMIRNAGL